MIPAGASWCALPITVMGLAQEQTTRIIAGQREDLEWLGLTVDAWTCESELLPAVNMRLAELGVTPQAESVYPTCPRLMFEGRPIAYPYTPTLTAQKVLMDAQQGVTLLVRGLDLLSEYSLYAHYCRQFDVPEPEHVYTPRLLSYHGDITKTNGGYKIAELRANGYTPQDVRDHAGKSMSARAAERLDAGQSTHGATAMTFIAPDEFIIAVDYRGFYRTGLQVPEIQQLRDAGVRTMLQHPIWRNIETEFGHYDWESTDEMADLAQQRRRQAAVPTGRDRAGFLPG